MKDDDTSPIILFTIWLIMVVICSLIVFSRTYSKEIKGIDSLYNLNRSNSLSEGVYVKDNSFLEAFSPNYYEGEVLGSYKDTTSEKWKDVIMCESTWRHYDENGNLLEGDKHLTRRAYGIAQFQKRTFKWLCQLADREDLSIENENDQIWLLRWSIDNGYGYLWSCY